jgi:hypothetical protein
VVPFAAFLAAFSAAFAVALSALVPLVEAVDAVLAVPAAAAVPAPTAVLFPAAAVPAIWKAITPPNGPALFAISISISLKIETDENSQFAIFMKHTFCCPATVPEQVVPAGTAMSMGKSILTFDARATRPRARSARRDRPRGTCPLGLMLPLLPGTSISTQYTLSRGQGKELGVRRTSHDIRLDTVRKLARSRGIDQRLDRSSAVGGDDVESARDAAAVADLGESGAALGHGGYEHVRGVGALAPGLAQAVGRDLGLAEDGGVDFGDFVLSGAGDDGALDAEGGAVAACVACDGGDFAVGGDEGRAEGEGREDEGVGVEEHGCWWWDGWGIVR